MALVQRLLAAAIGALVLFFWDYQRHLSLHPLFESPILLLKYYFCWLGAPLALSLGRAAWVAGLGLSLVFAGLSVAALFRPGSARERNVACAFVALGCYALMAGAAASLGRVEMEFDWALGSRYITFSIYLPIAAVGLAALHFSRGDVRGGPFWKRPRQLALVLIITAILATSLSTYRAGMKGMNWTRWQRAHGRAALLLSDLLPHNPELKILSPKPAAMIRTYRALLRAGMARAALISLASIPKLEPWAGGDRSHGLLDVCEMKRTRLRMKGWAVRHGKKPAPFVLLAYRAGGQAAIPFAVAPTGDSSPGLIRRGRRNCGFKLELEPDLPRGQIEISAWAIDPQTNQVEQLAGSHLIEIASRK